MKKTTLAMFVAALLAPTIALAIQTSPQRYHVVRYTFSGSTSSITAAPMGVLPQAGMRLVDVQISQSTAGVGGTSWTATPKRNGTAMTSTNGGFTLAAGAGKSTNALTSPMGAFTNPTGGTRPVIQRSVSASQTVSVGTLAATDVFYVTSTVNSSTVFTARDSGATGWDVNIGVSTTASADNLVAKINAHPAAPVVAANANGVVTLTSKRSGSGGNAIAIGQTGGHITVGGATLASGLDWVSGAGDVLTVDVTLSGSYSTAPSGSVALYFEPKIQ